MTAVYTTMSCAKKAIENTEAATSSPYTGETKHAPGNDRYESRPVAKYEVIITLCKTYNFASISRRFSSRQNTEKRPILLKASIAL